MDLARSHVLVCGGTGCTSSGSEKIIEKFESCLAEKGLSDVKGKTLVAAPQSATIAYMK